MKTSITSPSLRRKIWIGAFSVLALGGFFVFLASLSSSDKPTYLFSYLSSHSVDSLSLTVDIQAIYEKDSSDLPATLHWVEADGKKIDLPLEVSIRGNNRRELCAFPPLKLETSSNKALGIQKARYKLVTHCVAGTGESLLLREFLAYQIYAGLTDASFRTHLVRITYTDSSGKNSPVESWAFLLESKKELMDRLDAVEFEEEKHLQTISAEDYNRFAVFQFMIGNTDWNLDKGHNVKMLVPRKGGVPYPVPYDFDRSGLVNAPYAIPHSMLPINTVQDRFFQWRGKDRTQLEPVLEDFRRQKEALIGLCRDFDCLSAQDRQDMVEYLEEFFQKMQILLGDGRWMVHTKPIKEEGVS